MPEILAERLYAEFKAGGWTQERLAEVVGISREQCGKHLRKKGAIRINEQTARGYERAFGCTRQELAMPPKGGAKTLTGWTRFPVLLSDKERLVLRLTAMRYRTDAYSILRMSAALFTIVAEQQLAERARRLAAAEEQAWNICDGLDHLAGMAQGASRIEEALCREKAAIAAKDLTGATLLDEDWNEQHSGDADLFQSFVERTLQGLAPDIYQPGLGRPELDMFEDQIQDLTQGDFLARMVLLKDDARPEDLADVPPEDRIAFLQARCSASTRAAYEEIQALSLDDL